jgi:hypothetical protein
MFNLSPKDCHERNYNDESNNQNNLSSAWAFGDNRGSSIGYSIGCIGYGVHRSIGCIGHGVHGGIGRVYRVSKHSIIFSVELTYIEQ